MYLGEGVECCLGDGVRANFWDAPVSSNCATHDRNSHGRRDRRHQLVRTKRARSAAEGMSARYAGVR